MSRPWKVTSNWIDNRQLYGVYRIIDVAELDHSGNREFYGGYVATREEAATIAEELNAKEKIGDKKKKDRSNAACKNTQLNYICKTMLSQ